MTITSVDTANPTGTDQITTYSQSVTGGTLYTQVVRPPNGGVVAVAMSFVDATRSLPQAKYTTFSATTGTLAVGAAGGANMVYLQSTGATPGNQAMRTPAQVLADSPGLTTSSTYMLRIINTGAGTFTLTTDSGTGWTITGTATIAQNVWNDYEVSFASGTTGTIQYVGKGTV